jgi:hypothetical protein
MQEITFGQYGLSVILSAIMAVVFMVLKRDNGTNILSDKWKNLVVIFAGLALGMLSLWYFGKPLVVKEIVNALLEGFFTAMSAVGLWKTLGIQTGKDLLTNTTTPTSGGGMTR